MNSPIPIPLNAFTRWRQRHRRRTTPGSVPGTITIDPAMPFPEMHLMSFSAEEFREREIKAPEEATEELKTRPFVWLQVEGLGSEEILQRIKAAFGLHRLAMEDVVNLHQRAKVEEYDGYAYIVLRLAVMNGDVHTEQISLFVGKNFVISFEERDNDALEPIKNRLRKGLGIIRTMGPDFLAYAIIDAVIDRYFPILEGYGDRIEAIETELLASFNRDTVKKVHTLKQDLLCMRRAIWPARDAINVLLRDQIGVMGKEVHVYLRDCYDHVTQIIDILETDRELSSDLMDLHMSNVSNRTNEVMKVLTIMSSIFIPLSFIASLYGMNFDTDVSPYNMPELAWPYGYPGVLLLMLTVGLSMLGFAWKKGWIGRGP